MNPRDAILADVLRLVTVAAILIAQGALLYSLSVVRVRVLHHRPDCPFDRPWWRQDHQVPDPSDCPHCIWSRIYAYNRVVVILGWVVLSVALLSSVYWALGR